MRSRRLVLTATLAAIVVAACSSTTTPIARIGSSPGSIGVGDQRVLIVLQDPETNELLASEDLAATATLRDEDGTPMGTVELEFLWTVPESVGIYLGYFDFPEAGIYQLSVKAGTLNETGPVGFQVVADPLVVGVGDPAPQSMTRTGAEFSDLAVISSDPVPDPSFYDTSVAAAVTSGSPSVLVFATPAFCTSAACGPMLEQVKALSGQYPGVDFVHIEIYEDLQVQDPADLTVVDAALEWALPSEPWVFVVDRQGIVVAAFEGALNDEELTSALDALAP